MAVSPQKYRTEMCEDLEVLIKEGLIEFPYEYDSRGTMTIEKDDGRIEIRDVSEEETVTFMNIDLLKYETTSIHRTGSRDSPKYELPKNKARKEHDDRFYALALLGKVLMKMRTEDELSKSRKKKSKSKIASYQLYN